LGNQGTTKERQILFSSCTGLLIFALRRIKTQVTVITDFKQSRQALLARRRTLVIRVSRTMPRKKLAQAQPTEDVSSSGHAVFVDLFSLSEETTSRYAVLWGMTPCSVVKQRPVCCTSLVGKFDCVGRLTCNASFHEAL
jgi:hypothetical protein